MWLQVVLAHMVTGLFLLVALQLFHPMDYFTGGKGGAGLVMIGVATLIVIGATVMDRREKKRNPGRANARGRRRDDQGRDDAMY